MTLIVNSTWVRERHWYLCGMFRFAEWRRISWTPLYASDRQLSHTQSALQRRLPDFFRDRRIDDFAASSSADVTGLGNEDRAISRPCGWECSQQYGRCTSIHTVVWTDLEQFIVHCSLGIFITTASPWWAETICQHPQQYTVTSWLTVAPSAECMLSVDVGDRQTDGDRHSLIKNPFTSNSFIWTGCVYVTLR